MVRIWMITTLGGGPTSWKLDGHCGDSVVAEGV